MGWNGSGLFVRLYNWVADAAAGINIEAVRMDGEDDNLTAGINNCVAKDGQNAATANLPMGGFRHTNVGNAANRNEYLTQAQNQDNSGLFFTTAGVASAFTVTVSPAISSYVDGMKFFVKFHADCDDAATINFNSVGARDLVIGDTAVVAGELKQNHTYLLVYNGSTTSFMVFASYVGKKFTSLEDTPSDYTGFAGSFVKVNTAEDALEFTTSSPFASARVISNVREIAAGVTVKLNFNTEEFDTGDNLVNLASHQFDIPSDGVYQICFNLGSTEATGINAAWRMMIYKNGTLLSGASKYLFSPSSEIPGGTLTALANLVAGDYIDFRVSHDYAGSIDTGVSTFDIFKVG